MSELEPDFKVGCVGFAYAESGIRGSTTYPKYNGSFPMLKYLSLMYLLSIFITWIMSIYNSRQKYVHMEVIFLTSSIHSENCIAFGVFTDGGAKKMERSFRNKNYHYVWLTVSNPKYIEKCYAYCTKSTSKRDKVDYHLPTVLRLFIWPQENPKPNERTCHSFIMSCLHCIYFMRDYRINTLTIDEIVSFLENSDRRRAGFLPHENLRIINA